MDILQELKDAKNYQLESLIRQFTDFQKQAVTNTADNIISIIVHEAKKELAKRQ